jgi:hypothetical protein
MRGLIMRTHCLLGGLALALTWVESSTAMAAAPAMFLTSDNCMACHNGMTSATGETVSFGVDWRATMMANAARDLYWQAAVRREITEHAPATAAIEKECSLCHMPMMNVQAKAAGTPAAVFANLGKGAPSAQALAAQDGVSCTVCHQIEATNLGKRESLVGNFVIDPGPTLPRKAMGPFEVKPPLARFMASATTFAPTQATHLRSSELCATCHTLITEALDERGRVIGRLPEQVPYQEWLASAYRATTSCASCHMPAVTAAAPMANILAEPRTGLGRHVFRGGNFMMPTLFREQATAMPALPEDLDREIAASRAYLGEAAARIKLSEPQLASNLLQVVVTIENRAGHKLPTAYPSRRVWLHARISDADGKVVFESGALSADGKIVGNENDENPDRFEPHYQRIERPDQVQVYEAVLRNAKGLPTTGLLHAVGYLKDNRLVPMGFDKRKAEADVAVHGEALDDADFVGGSDEVALRIDVGSGKPPFKVETELLYQPIGYRWGENLEKAGGAEPRAFVRAFRTAIPNGYQRLARAERLTPLATPTPP